MLPVVAAAVSILAGITPAAASGQMSQTIYYGYPTWSHDGKRIALVGQVDYEDSYLYVMNANGSGLHRIDTTGIDTRPDWPERISWPSWSPNDTRIAFTAAAGSYSIWVIASDGRGLHRVADHGLAPAWSPGGRWIAYADVAETSGAVVHVVRPDGNGDLIAAEPDEDQSFISPTWSPDGKYLAFGIASAPHTNPRPDAPGMGVSRRYGERPRFLLAGHRPYGLAWSPSGREIAFTEDGYVSVLDLSTRTIKRLQIGDFPSWSPDGKRIVFSRGPGYFGGSIFVMNRDGSHVRLLLPEGRV